VGLRHRGATAVAGAAAHRAGIALHDARRGGWLALLLALLVLLLLDLLRRAGRRAGALCVGRPRAVQFHRAMAGFAFLRRTFLLRLVAGWAAVLRLRRAGGVGLLHRLLLLFLFRHRCGFRLLEHRLGLKRTAGEQQGDRGESRFHYVCTSLRWRCTLRRMPAPMKSVRSAVPPYDRNGNGTPTTGRMPDTMPMLTNAYVKNMSETEPARSRANTVAALAAIYNPRPISRKYSTKSTALP